MMKKSTITDHEEYDEDYHDYDDDDGEKDDV